MVQHADIGVHPAMDVALHGNHDFRPGELARDGIVAGAHAVVPLAVYRGHGMNVVRDRIGVDDLERLAHLDAHYTRTEPASALIYDDSGNGCLKGLSFQALLNVYEGIGNHAVRPEDERLVMRLSLVRL